MALVTTLYSKQVKDEEGEPLALVTADTYQWCPIELTLAHRGESLLMDVWEARLIRKALKRAIKAAEAYHGKDA